MHKESGSLAISRLLDERVEVWVIYMLLVIEKTESSYNLCFISWVEKVRPCLDADGSYVLSVAMHIGTCLQIASFPGFPHFYLLLEFTIHGNRHGSRRPFGIN